MNVLFVASWYPSKLQAKNGNFIEQHAKAVISAGCNVRVVHIVYSKRILVPQIKSVLQNGIQVYHVYMPFLAKNSDRTKGFILNKLIAKLKRDDFMPNIIHGHVVYPAGEFALQLCEKLNLPLVITEHWSGYKPVNASVFTPEIARLTQNVLNKAQLILPVSHDLKDCMIAKGFLGNYAVVNNTVDTSVFFAQAKESHRRFQFLHVSNFAPRAKNTEGIIRAFLQGNFSNAQLTIAGDGDLNRLKKFSESLHADLTNIRFLGSLSYNDVANLMRESDCFVLFSNFENLPCVIAESHCCGLPVLATNVGGIPEMIDNTNGRIVTPGNEEELIAEMHLIIEQKDAFDPELIASEAIRRYSYEVIGNQFLEHFKAVLKQYSED